jgi:exopolyphosphatase/guanosine-5'-triphosphate,3'-diphosphate pyrophosphatase
VPALDQGAVEVEDDGLDRFEVRWIEAGHGRITRGCSGGTGPKDWGGRAPGVRGPRGPRAPAGPIRAGTASSGATFPRNIGRERTAREERCREVGVVDLGSNTARLVLFRSNRAGPPWSVFESKETPRLAQDLGPLGRLSLDGIDRATGTLARFGRILRDRRPDRVAIVATSAVRDAPNRGRFLTTAARRCGYPIRPLTAREEAFYAYRGVAASLPLHTDRLFDLGGGSVQVMATRDGRFASSISYPLGALRMHAHFLKRDPPKEREFDALVDFLDISLERIPKCRPTERVIGIGGTVRSLARVLREAGELPYEDLHGAPVGRADLERLVALFRETPTEVRREIPGLSADRADVALAGALVVLRLMRRLGVAEITVSACGLREGVAADLFRQTVPKDAEVMAVRSARSAGAALGLASDHAERVRGHAKALFTLAVARGRLGPEHARVVEVAAILHDAGTVLSYAHHPAHSAYFVTYRQLYGLSPRERVLAAAAVDLHERYERSGTVMARAEPDLDRQEERTVERLGALIAVAEAVSEGGDRPKFTWRSERLTIHIGRGGAAQPKLLERAARSFRRAFDVEVTLHAG